MIHISYQSIALRADSTKTRAQAMHKIRTFPVRESSQARGGNAARNGREKKEGERRGSDEKVQGTANFERVS